VTVTWKASSKRCIATDADHASLERELATRFYRAVHGSVGPAVGGGLRRRHVYRTRGLAVCHVTIARLITTIDKISSE
jgi:hypothetical protein